MGAPPPNLLMWSGAKDALFCSSASLARCTLRPSHTPQLSLCPWDLAAGSLLVTEAGGCVTDMSGAPYSLHTAHVFASNGAPGIHAPLVKLLVDAKVDTC